MLLKVRHVDPSIWRPHATWTLKHLLWPPQARRTQIRNHPHTGLMQRKQRPRLMKWLIPEPGKFKQQLLIMLLERCRNLKRVQVQMNRGKQRRKQQCVRACRRLQTS